MSCLCNEILETMVFEGQLTHNKLCHGRAREPTPIHHSSLEIVH
jgi:hypothetical protein